jgi:recombination protein RecR
MRAFSASVERLVEKFESLPGIGHKSAQRLAFYILSLPDSEAEDFASAIVDAKRGVCQCSVCCNLSDTEICPICASDNRDPKTICVVSDPRDVAAIERTHEYTGRYHVLHGVISPINHIGPDELRIKELVNRVGREEIDEVIMATDPDTEGEATAMYIARLLRPFHVKITRLAYGVPVGGHLEYSDEVTLLRALDGRREY